MSHFDQRGQCVAEKVVAQQTRRDKASTRRKIGSRCGEAVAGMSMHLPMS